MNKSRYIVVRAGLMVVSLFAVATLLFLLFRILPGNPTSILIDPGITKAAREQLLASYGLDKPLHIQYFLYIKNLAIGNLGVSFTRNQPVTKILIESTLNTLVLILSAVLLAFLSGPIIGAVFAWNRGSSIDRYGVISILTLFAIPVFWSGMLGIMLFSFRLGWLPSGGMTAPGAVYDSKLDMYLSVDFLRHLMLPFLITTLYYLSVPTLIMRNTMIDVMGSDFIEMLRAQGLDEIRIMFRHAARNSMLPVMHQAAISIGFAFGGSVIIETVFSWPGVGRVLWIAVNNQDYPLAQGGFLMIAAIIIILNFLVDVISVYIDPRAAIKGEGF